MVPAAQRVALIPYQIDLSGIIIAPLQGLRFFGAHKPNPLGWANLYRAVGAGKPSNVRTTEKSSDNL
jgi:hypothetical protein